MVCVWWKPPWARSEATLCRGGGSLVDIRSESLHGSSQWWSQASRLMFRTTRWIHRRHVSGSKSVASGIRGGDLWGDRDGGLFPLPRPAPGRRHLPRAVGAGRPRVVPGWWFSRHRAHHPNWLDGWGPPMGHPCGRRRLPAAAVPDQGLKGPRPASGGWTLYIACVMGWPPCCGVRCEVCGWGKPTGCSFVESRRRCKARTAAGLQLWH